jgi:hypothetical protein
VLTAPSYHDRSGLGEQPAPARVTTAAAAVLPDGRVAVPGAERRLWWTPQLLRRTDLKQTLVKPKIGWNRLIDYVRTGKEACHAKLAVRVATQRRRPEP